LKTKLLLNPLVQGAGAVLALTALTAVCFFLHLPREVVICLFAGLLVGLSYSGNRALSIVVAVIAALSIDFLWPVFTLAPQDPLDWAMVALFSGIAWTMTTMVATLRRRSRELEDANAKMKEQQARELERANRLMLVGEMTTSIVHEVNQPLTGITSNAGTSLRYLGSATPDYEAVRHYLELVVRDAWRASEIIKRIRAMASRAAPNKAPVDINEAVTEVIALAQDQLKRGARYLRRDLAPALPAVSADRVQLQQFVLNLIVNANEAMKELGESEPLIVVRSGRVDGSRVFLEVRDCGPGLQEGDVDRLFDAFYTTKANGMGMGLAISRSIAEAHDGELAAFPNEPAGAVFRLTLPIEDEAANAP
jgi:C4-dicarboxylate-specific signal transduction histidine kinase